MKALKVELSDLEAANQNAASKCTVNDAYVQLVSKLTDSMGISAEKAEACIKLLKAESEKSAPVLEKYQNEARSYEKKRSESEASKHFAEIAKMEAEHTKLQNLAKCANGEEVADFDKPEDFKSGAVAASDYKAQAALIQKDLDAKKCTTGFFSYIPGFAPYTNSQNSKAAEATKAELATFDAAKAKAEGHVESSAFLLNMHEGAKAVASDSDVLKAFKAPGGTNVVAGAELNFAEVKAKLKALEEASVKAFGDLVGEAITKEVDACAEKLKANYDAPRNMCGL